jgi:hypothetical protein
MIKISDGPASNLVHLDNGRLQPQSRDRDRDRGRDRDRDRVLVDNGRLQPQSPGIKYKLTTLLHGRCIDLP